VNTPGRVGRGFWLPAAVYLVIVGGAVLLIAPGVRWDGLAAIPVMGLTLPTSAVVAFVSTRALPQRGGVGLLVSIGLVSAVLNINIAYLIALWHAGRAARFDEDEER